MHTTSPPAVSSLKVAQLIETLNMGGAENLAVRMANALAAAGHESHLIVMTEPGILSERISPDVKVHYLEFWRSSIRNPLGFVTSLGLGQRLLGSLLEKEGIQVVQTHLPGCNFWGLLLALRKVRPIIATIHNNEEFNYGEVDNRLIRHFRKRAYQMILRRCFGTVAVSEDVADSLARDLRLTPLEAERIHVVTNGVELQAPLDEAAKLRVREELSVPVDVPLVLGAGRLGEQKNFRDLISAAAILRDQSLDFRIVIAGEGELRSDLEAQIDQHDLSAWVHLPGNLTNLDEVMEAADIFALPSLWEGLSLVLLEAMSHSLAVVANDIKGMDRVLDGARNGLVAEAGAPESLANALEALIRDENRCRELGLQARKTVAEQFDFRQLIHQVGALYGTAVLGSGD